MQGVLVVAGASAALGLFLAASLWASAATRANRWLAASMLAFALLAVQDALDESALVLRWAHFAHLFDWLIFVLGPLTYIYVRRMTGDEAPRGGRLVLHALPALLAMLLLLPFWLSPAPLKREILEADRLSALHDVDPVLLSAVAHMLGYWIAALAVLGRYRHRLRQRYSEIERRSLIWLSVMLAVNLVMWIVWSAAVVLDIPWLRILDDLFVPLGLYLLGFLALRRSADLPTPVAPRKYQRSGLSEQRSSDLRAELTKFVELEKPWLENDLTLDTLAERARMSPHHLSQLLNEHLGKNFFDYINEHRVREVQRCLSDPRYRATPLLDIALAAGFNSKGAFNAAFRKFTGQTPSAYRDRLRQGGENRQADVQSVRRTDDPIG